MPQNPSSVAGNESSIPIDLSEFVIMITTPNDEDSDPPTHTGSQGGKYWRNSNDKLHRDNDKPAIIHANGDQEWYVDGKLHRDNDLPAIMTVKGTQQWYQHGKLHRDNDKPAIVGSNGQLWWYQHGLLHRDNCKPVNGHNNDVIRHYHVNGIHLYTVSTANTTNIEVKATSYGISNCDAVDVNDLDPPTEVDSYGDKYWRNSQGQLHRESDKPAVMFADGTQAWYQNGKLHRAGDKPAWVSVNSSNSWWKHGQLHRDNDKPAYIQDNGSQSWYVNGECTRRMIPSTGFHVYPTPPTEITYRGDKYWMNSNGRYHRVDDMPAVIHHDGTLEWWVNGERHRDPAIDKPAIMYAHGGLSWYVKGQLHRDGDKPAEVRTNGSRLWYVKGSLHRDNDKPAIEWSNGSREWYMNGFPIRKYGPNAISSDGTRTWSIDGHSVPVKAPFMKGVSETDIPIVGKIYRHLKNELTQRIKNNNSVVTTLEAKVASDLVNDVAENFTIRFSDVVVTINDTSDAKRKLLVMSYKPSSL